MSFRFEGPCKFILFVLTNNNKALQNSTKHIQSDAKTIEIVKIEITNKVIEKTEDGWKKIFCLVYELDKDQIICKILFSETYLI